MMATVLPWFNLGNSAVSLGLLGDKYFTNITAENAMGLIDELRKSPDYTPAKLADAIVKIHLPGSSLTGGGSSTVDDLTLPAGPML